MIDGNISMEEDTELRDLVVQTLENKGVLAKVRAELRASVFLALEEQESVMNPEPLLNKTVKQYLANSEGKLLFSLVREFLEYFGLDYTISVYDPETYFGKEYNYVGRNKLCEELGINSSEPLLGEILKSSISSACNITQKNESNDCSHNEINKKSTNIVNATFEVSTPKMLHASDDDSTEKIESISEQSSNIPINVTITDRKDKDEVFINDTINVSNDKEEDSVRENITDENSINGKGNNNIHFDIKSTKSNNADVILNNAIKNAEIVRPSQTIALNKSESLITFDDSILSEVQINQNENIAKQNSINNKELQVTNNLQNKKSLNMGSSMGKTVYFEEIIVDGKRENIGTMHKTEPFLGNLPPLDHKPNSIFSDLPPLNGKKTNMKDLKELMDTGLADGIDNYEEDFVSSASGSANEQSPSKELNEVNNPLKLQVKKEDTVLSGHSEDISEEIDEILSSTSCLEDMNMEKKVSNFTTGITADYIKEM